MLKHLFVPTPKNGFTARLLSKKALSIYAVVLFAFNIFFGATNTFIVEAALDYNQLYALHNEERAKVGLQPLVVNTDLIESATAKGKAMLAADCWSHYCPEGVSPWSFFDDAGYVYVYAGENLAEGFTTVDNVMQAWMNSPTHKDNVLNPNFTEIGIGVAYGNYQGMQNNMILVVHFGSRKDLPANDQNTKVADITGSETLAITSPNDGDFVTVSQPDIIGIAPANSDIKILANGDDLSPRIHTTGESFTYRPSTAMTDGNYDLSLQSYESNILVDTSETINITIDTVPPYITQDNVQVTSLDYFFTTTAIIAITANEPTNYISLNLPIKGEHKLDQLTTEYEVSESEILGATELIITAYDKAGNQNTTKVPTKDLLNQIESLTNLYPPPTFSSSMSVLAGITSRIVGGDVKQQVNIIFVLFIAILFGIDFYVLHKSGLTGRDKGHSHLHFSLFAVLFIILIAANFSGEILTGQSAL